MRFPRSAGILLHPTSLPGSFGIGSLGAEARRFVDFLAAAGQSLWQVLPLGPTGYGDSPYQCFSAFAGNPLLIDLQQLVEEGDLEEADRAAAAGGPPQFPTERVDYGAVIDTKTALLRRAAKRFRAQADPERRAAFDQFCTENAHWLDDYALFMAIKEAHGGAVWTDWEPPLAAREPEALDAARARHQDALFAQRYAQFQFHRQWTALKRAANDRGVRIIGDVPIFVAFDSADLWAHADLFHLDESLQPTVVAGVPPDYFSRTGQLWGNPLYRWDVMAARGFAWWLDRIRHALATVDILRLDHFRGFAAYWEVPAGQTTAEGGRWVDGPGAAFFQRLRDELGSLPLIAEDLGLITDDVIALRDQFDLPGMVVLQFAWTSDAANSYLPHNHRPNRVVYTGTHDNDTTVGWYASREGKEKTRIDRYLGPTEEPIHQSLIRTAYRSVCDLAVVPLQDVLGLGTEARMNTPGKEGGNWAWRVAEAELTEERATGLRELAGLYGRLPHAEQEDEAQGPGDG